MHNCPYDGRVTMTTVEQPGLRERKKRETHDRLRNVALRLATERGVDQVTIEDIAAEAGVSTRTFFNYFGSKEEVLVGPDPSSATDLAQALADRPAGESPLESLRALMLMRSKIITERADDVRARMRLVTAYPALQPRYLTTASAMERVLTEGIAARTGTDPDADAYPALMAGVASAVMRTTIVSWLAGPGDRPIADLIDEAFDLIAAGLPAPDHAPAQQSHASNKKRTHR